MGGGFHGLDACYTSVADGLKAELALGPDGNFLVLGSFTSVAAALDWLGASFPHMDARL